MEVVGMERLEINSFYGLEKIDVVEPMNEE
jgi:hypothetical protein